jgi:hypothetical protein
MLYLFVALKVPIVIALWLIWWAIKEEPDASDDSDDGGIRKRPHPSPLRPRPRQRGPHGDPAPVPSPPRVRTATTVRARELD